MVYRDFFLGFIKVHILHHASKEPVYGSWISQELSRHGYYLSPSTLYPTLHRLEQDGYLEQRSKVVEGTERKYYTITESGLEVLAEARDKIKNLVDEVLEKDG